MLLGKELYRQLVREATHLPDARIRLVSSSSARAPPRTSDSPVLARSEHYLALVRSTFLERSEPESSQQAARRTKHAQKVRSLGFSLCIVRADQDRLGSSFDSCRLLTMATFML